MLKSSIYKISQWAASIGVSLATFISLNDFIKSGDPNVKYLTVGWVMFVVCLRYFLRASNSLSQMRSRVINGLSKPFLSTFLFTHFVLILLTCINTTIIKTIGVSLAVSILTIQAVISIFQWMLVFNPIFVEGPPTVSDGQSIPYKVKRKYYVAHGITVCIDLMTLFIAAVLISIIWFEENPSPHEALFASVVLFVLIVIEVAIHWLTESEWQSLVFDTQNK